MKVWLPALLVGLFAGWCGTYGGGATFSGSVVAYSSVLAMGCLGLRQWKDPLRTGTAGRWLLLVVILLASMGWWASPVRRAGTVALVLLPAFLLLPAAVARCWAGEASRRRGLVGVSAVVAGVAGWCLVDYYLLGAPRAGAPLGHHSYLAAWLVLLLPLAALEARRPGPGRLWAVAAAVLGVAAVAVSRSLLGGLGLAVEVGLAAFVLGDRTAPRSRRLLKAGGVFLILAVAAVGPRFFSLARLDDSSLRARWTYWLGGLRGVAERPFLGLGPGSTPWTLAQHMKPVPGVNPPEQLVGDLHSLPLQWAYELGLPALLLAIAVAFLALRGRIQGAADRPMAAAALLGLGGRTLLAKRCRGRLSWRFVPG